AVRVVRCHCGDSSSSQSPHNQSNSWLAATGELHASGFENLAKAINRPLAYSLTTLEPDHSVGRHFCGCGQFSDA
ncbi:MAG: hypothetical protein WBW37_18440, partial [Methyloceanibacter sp.]